MKINSVKNETDLLYLIYSWYRANVNQTSRRTKSLFAGVVRALGEDPAVDPETPY